MAKVMLSDFEAMLVNNSEWILTKHRVMEKASCLLSDQLPVINEVFLQAMLPVLPGLAACRPKLSKGERYRDLPYLVLDYPAVFSKREVFALRTMFWWGNFISVTLHLSGQYKKQFEASLLYNLGAAGNTFYISTGEQEWEHHFEEDNYGMTDERNKKMLEKKIVQSSFVKIALRYDLHQWNDMNELLRAAYGSLAAALHS